MRARECLSPFHLSSRTCYAIDIPPALTCAQYIIPVFTRGAFCHTTCVCACVCATDKNWGRSEKMKLKRARVYYEAPLFIIYVIYFLFCLPLGRKKKPPKKSGTTRSRRHGEKLMCV